MQDEIEQRILDAPLCDTARAVLPCMLRLRDEGNSFEAIAAGLLLETGIYLTKDAVERILAGTDGSMTLEQSAIFEHSLDFGVSADDTLNEIAMPVTEPPSTL